MKFEFCHRSIPKNSISFQDGNGCLSNEEFLQALQGANFVRRFGHFHQHPLSPNIKSRESKSRELKGRESTSIKCHKYRNVRHVPGLSMQNQLMIIGGDRDFSKTYG